MKFRELKGYTYGYRGLNTLGKTSTPLCLKEHIYAFKTDKKNRYVVRVEEYLYSLFVLKFHLKSHSNSEFKYVLLSGFRDDPRRIIETCIIIGHDILKKYPLASFGFLGSPIEDELKRGKIDKSKMLKSTKRYNLYRKFAANYFNVDSYIHRIAPDKSSYLLINKEAQQQNPNITTEIESMFEEHCDIEEVFYDLLEVIENK